MTNGKPTKNVTKRARGRPRGEAQAKSTADRVRKMVAGAANIGTIRDIVDLARRERCRLSLADFLLTYLPESFPDPFSADHLVLIATIEHVILRGGRYIDCEPRGFGKSTICEGAVLWCALYGHRMMTPLLSTVKDTASKSMKSIMSELTNNPLLADDFPEVCQPVAGLDGVAQRAHAQTYTTKAGEVAHTGIEWKTEEIVFPSIEGSPSAGVVVCVYGIESRKARGLRYKRTDGVQVRPGFILIDDPQDNQIARNPVRVAMLLDNLKRSILMSGGHKKKLACVIVATVIEKNDFSDQLLQDAGWIGRRVAMMKALPTHMDVWLGEYKTQRQNFQRGDATDKAKAEGLATEFYRAKREIMDKGAAPAWEHCFSEDEISATQHAINLLIDLGDRAFASECQNEPLDPYAASGQEPLDPRDVLAKANALTRCEIPLWAHTVTAFVDVGARTHIHFAIAAFGARYSGHVVDYGVIEVKKGPASGVEEAITEAMERAVTLIIGRAYPVEGGSKAEKRIDRVLIDAGWQSRVVYNFCREKDRQYPGLIRPSKGYATEKYRTPKVGSGARRGDHWHLIMSENRAAYLCHYDADHWKSFLDARWRIGPGGAGGLSVFRGDNLEFAQHCTAERPQRKKTRDGNDIDVWRLLPGRQNHFLDCVSGCLIGASTCGVTLEGDASGAGPVAERNMGGFRKASGRTLSALGFGGRK